MNVISELLIKTISLWDFPKVYQHEIWNIISTLNQLLIQQHFMINVDERYMARQIEVISKAMQICAPIVITLTLYEIAICAQP